MGLLQWLQLVLQVLVLQVLLQPVLQQLVLQVLLRPVPHNWYYKYYNNRYYNNWYHKYNYINYFNYYIDYINDYINYINNYSLNKDAIQEESKVLILSQFFGMEHLKHYCTFWWRDLWDNGISVYDDVIVSIIL